MLIRSQVKLRGSVSIVDEKKYRLVSKQLLTVLYLYAHSEILTKYVVEQYAFQLQQKPHGAPSLRRIDHLLLYQEFCKSGIVTNIVITN